MICYKDRTFCASDCENEECFRFLSIEERDKAAKDGWLFSFSDFADVCPDYKPPVKEQIKAMEKTNHMDNEL